MAKSISNRQKFSRRHWSFAKIPNAAGFPAVKQVFILNNLNQTLSSAVLAILVAILVAFKSSEWYFETNYV